MEVAEAAERNIRTWMQPDETRRNKRFVRGEGLRQLHTTGRRQKEIKEVR